MGQQSDDDERVQGRDGARQQPALEGAAARLPVVSKPLIAAVEGYAVAGGTEILQGTDIRVAGEGAIFGVWEAKRGLFPLGGSACRLPRQIPYTQAMDILLACRPIPAIEAQGDRARSAASFPTAPRSTSPRQSPQQVAANAPLSTQAILRAWRETEHMSDSDAMQHQDTIGWEVFASEDAQEGPTRVRREARARVQGPLTCRKRRRAYPTHPPSRHLSARRSRRRCAH